MPFFNNLTITSKPFCFFYVKQNIMTQSYWRILSLIVLFSFSLEMFAQENCTNGIDDDNDGQVDLNDGECSCSGFSSNSINLISNPSIDNYSSCPSGTGSMSMVNDWVTGSNNDPYIGTANFWHSCGSTNLNEIIFPPSSSTTGYLGFWNTNGGATREFVSTCLDNA